MGIEPTQPAWKAGALPLSYTRGWTRYFLFVSAIDPKQSIKASPGMPDWLCVRPAPATRHHARLVEGVGFEPT